MESFETFLKFINSYPIWAKTGIFAGIIVSISIAVFAPRGSIAESSAVSKSKATIDSRVLLLIEDIKLFPANENIDIQLYAVVNGTKYKHPSVAGVEWMKVGPNMSHQLIELPKADGYEIRFELKYKGGSVVEESATNLVAKEFEHMASQMVTQVLALPFTETYNLYKIKEGSRDSSVSSSVKYTLYQE
ncbi:hypothetical protein CXF72_08110 [Psychromonas sp. MB-3u-54]|uniref:hypothetical protein n=1 Tax=Psychromonas sp. MB-3u-54 TaxID=2058319 RepID=UPI000C34B315|nr:hypothetical protein [Psychromonas sp. MB-3u-54]PKH03138.1 hypothetical protein CXF72_08110 [Psychromonas sp. MB-3u-54]